MRTILWFIYFWIYLIGLLPKQKKAEKAFQNKDQKTVDAYVTKEVRGWANALLNKAGVTVEVSGLENIPKEPAVFVSNHQGNFDIPVLLACLDKPKSFVAKMELQKVPMIRSWMKYLNCIFIDRNDVRQSISALNNSYTLLEQGYSIVIFPEGTRSKGKDIGEFKHGAFKMAFKHSSPIVPVAIEGTYKVMEANGGWIKPATVKLRVLPAVETKGLTKEETRALGESIGETLRIAREEMM